ncbi:MAG: ISL3 family transposase [Acidiferrobacteraceae bacterium]
MPANILSLPQYKVLGVKETDHDYHIRAEPVEPTKVCPYCKSEQLRSWGTREQLFKDLPMHGKRAGIYIDTRRFKCNRCSKDQDKTVTFFEALPGISANRMMTTRLVDWIGPQSLRRTFLSLAEETGVVEGTIRNIFRDYITDLEKTVRFETPRWMGIDEIPIIKPRCVISNTQNNAMVDILSNRNRETITKRLFLMPNRDKIQYVAMDMWMPYRDAVEAVLPHAKIIIDKFHVVRMANDAMKRVRKTLRADLLPKQRRGLMHDRFVLLKREADLTDQERLSLDGWTKNYPVLGQAYRLKESFYSIYDARAPDEAMERYETWYRGIPPELDAHFSDIIRAWSNWQPYILNYFDHPIANSFTEGLNALIRVMNRLGRGYSFEALRAKILFTEGAHSNKKGRPKFERKGSPERLRVAEPDTGFHYNRSGVVSYATLNKSLKLQGPPKAIQQQEGYKTEKNYGVDIAILVRMIESGEL